jgi:hypothetical protein
VAEAVLPYLVEEAVEGLAAVFERGIGGEWCRRRYFLLGLVLSGRFLDRLGEGLRAQREREGEKCGCGKRDSIHTRRGL